LVCGIHLRDPLKPVRGLPGLVIVPGASNCSTEPSRDGESRLHVVGILLATIDRYEATSISAYLF
jgi:hypothetical protein